MLSYFINIFLYRNLFSQNTSNCLDSFFLLRLMIGVVRVLKMEIFFNNEIVRLSSHWTK